MIKTPMEANSIFEYAFMQRALLAAIFTSIACGITGTWIVSKRLVFISGGITHASFGGIGAGYFLGFNPIIGAAAFALASAFGIEYFSKKTEVRQDSMIAILWSLGMALGIILIYLTPGYSPNLTTYLFGSLLSVTIIDLIAIALVSLAVVVVFSVFYNSILFISFDESFAMTRGLPVKGINYLLMGLTALVIVFSIRLAGIILIISLLSLPQNIAGLFTKSFRGIMLISVITALTASLSGLLISYYFNVPSGASIVFLLALAFAVIKGFTGLKRKKSRQKLAKYQ